MSNPVAKLVTLALLPSLISTWVPTASTWVPVESSTWVPTVPLV